MMSECPARLSFPQAPYLDCQCTRPPGHDGLHETRAQVKAALVPYSEHSRYSSVSSLERPPEAATTVEIVWLTWAQEVPAW